MFMSSSSAPFGKTEVYWEQMQHPLFQNKPIFLAATDQGLCLLTLPHESFDMLESWVMKHTPGARLTRSASKMEAYIQQVQAYLDGERQSFTCPLDLRGTAFQRSVWQALINIPYGQAQSYSEIAETIGSPKAVRAVGAANGINPVPIIVPCHRVIGKGKSLTGYRGGLKVKEALLQLEGFHSYTAKGHNRFQF